MAWQDDVMSDYKILIGGALQQGAGAAIEVMNPATEKVIAQINTATPAQLDEAVEAAQKHLYIGARRRYESGRACLVDSLHGSGVRRTAW